MTDLLTRVKCRATCVAKNEDNKARIKFYNMWCVTKFIQINFPNFPQILVQVCKCIYPSLWVGARHANASKKCAPYTIRGGVSFIKDWIRVARVNFLPAKTCCCRRYLGRAELCAPPELSAPELSAPELSAPELNPVQCSIK